MALIAGTVVIADDGTVSGGGLARALFDAHMSIFPPFGERGQLKNAQQGIAAYANAQAAAIRDYLVANAVVQPGSFEAGGDAVTGTGVLT